jgi:uncharacterized protein YjbI with pentapeptide repeats
MKTREVLRRYAAGERDFCCANLRGQSFKGQKLSGADFSGADIRGTSFTNANLKGANFTQARGGLPIPWLVVQQMFVYLLAALAGSLSHFSSTIISAPFLNLDGLQGFALFIARVATGGLVSVTLIAIASQGFTTKTLRMIMIAAIGVGSVAIVIAMAVGIASARDNHLNFINTVYLSISFAIISAYSGTVSSVSAISGAFVVSAVVYIAVASAGILSGIITFTIAGTIAVSYVSGSSGAFTISYTAYTILAIILGLSIYMTWQAFKENKKFSVVRTFGIALSSMGGTSFQGADLTYANFSNTILKSTNFNHTKQKQTILAWVNWQGAKKLDYASVGNSILANPSVRDLLVTQNGYKKSYVNAYLRAINLDGVNLEEANLTLADLTCSTLRQANLKNANLSESLVLNTDFTGSNLTGACLEAWNLDSHTNLNQVDCQYVYLLRTEQERRPSSGDFAPGEFTKLFQEVLSTVDLIFRNGVDWKAFVTAFQQVQVENEDTPLEIQSIENKGDGVVVVRVNVPPDTNKAKIHSEFNQQYEIALAVLEAKYRAELQAKDGEIAIYREQSTNMWEVIKSQANRPINVKAIAESKSMSNSNDSSQNVNIGGNVTGSNINLGTISGNVTNTINQLPADTSDPNQPNLKVLLTQLQAAIEEDTSLPDEDKADLLGEVQNFAQAKQTEEPTKKEGLVRRAKKIFEATLKSLPETAKLVEASSKLLPMILKVIGFPA